MESDAKQDRGTPLATFDASGAPRAPGCYLMWDAKGVVVYVGKAKDLRARVRAYLNESDSRRAVPFLMRRAAAVEFLVTATEKEALLLENSLIKEHKPRYNVRLKDDKTYVSLRVNVRHEFPRITVTRRLKKDGAKYFGPYSSANAVRDTLRQLQRVFPLRTCADAVLRNRARPCLYYQMKRCVAPCVGHVDGERYREIVDQTILVLQGRNDEVEKVLLDTMQRHADALEFEQAAQVRDRLLALRKTLERQRTVRTGETGDVDVFGIYTDGRFSELQALFFRGGKMMGGRSFSFRHRDIPLDEVVSSFLVQYYAQAPSVPSEVLLPLALEDAGALAEMLGEKRGGRVAVVDPRRGEKRALVDLAMRNARKAFEEKRMADEANKDLLDAVRSKLHLSKPPHRVECFDISTIQGTKSVGSMATFEGGTPCKARYRRFTIRQVDGQDDFAMMREVLLRRYTRAIEEDDLPDMVLIDGGKGQLNVATTVLQDLGIEDLDVASIAKARPLEEGERSLERFFLPGRKNPVVLPQHSPVVLFLARVRDEAHRFAITHHRKRRSKAMTDSVLTEVPGVGPKRARTLLTRLGSVAQVRSASVETIAALPGFNTMLAQSVKSYLAAVPGGTPKRPSRATHERNAL